MSALSIGNWGEKLMFQLLGIQKWSEITVLNVWHLRIGLGREHVKNWEI